MSLPIRAKHALGQHFITDANLLRRMVAETPLAPGDAVFEVGPGLGDLTRVLAEQAGQVVALEVDHDLVPLLQQQFADQPSVQIVEGDVMEANLPYYLTTPILTLLLRLALPVASICVTVQQEAAQRVLAHPSSKEYGPLSILAQYRTAPRAALDIPRRSFTPPPHVESTFLVMPALEKPPVIVPDEAAFLKLVQTSFAMRRKTLVNNMMSAYGLRRADAQGIITQAGLSPTVRAEALSLDEYARLDAALRAFSP